MYKGKEEDKKGGTGTMGRRRREGKKTSETEHQK